MRIHKHALISLGYAGGISLFSGHGLTDPYLYLFAIVGGEVIDFIDHPLYHLFYRRKEAHVVHARKLFFESGLRGAIKYLNRIEDKREFKGLVLHNIFSLTLVAGLGVFSSLFFPSPTYLFVFLGAFLLHMLMDLSGDFWILGHANNWLWIVPKTWVSACSKRADSSKVSARICFYVLPWLWFPVFAFILVSVRVGWQLANPTFHSGLYVELRKATLIWIVGFVLLLLIFYALWLLLMCFAAVRKYSLEVGRTTKFSLESLSLLSRYLIGSIPRTRANAERVYLRVEADGAIWTVVATALITTVLMSMSWLHGKGELLFFLTPIFFALVFGTFIHSTVGELSGGFGVILSWILNTLLGRLHLQEFWPLRRGFLLLLAAVVAWTVGLLGAVFLRGISRMSVVVFLFQFLPDDEPSEDAIRSRLTLLTHALEKGYKGAHEILIGQPNKEFLRADPPPLLLQPYADRPMWGGNLFHLQASDSYCPMIREVSYTICGNELVKNSKRSTGLMPVMPRHQASCRGDGELYSSQRGHDEHGQKFLWNVFHWQSRWRPLTLNGPASMMDDRASQPRTHYLNKTWAEFIDHFVTRKSTFITDLFVGSNPANGLFACGVVRERTSTKEYATVEAEVYAGSVMSQIIASSSENDVPISSCNSVRLIYPRVSTFDEAVIAEAQATATLPSSYSAMSPKQFEIVKECVDKLSPKRVLPYATADFGKKLVVLAFELTFTTLVVAMGFNPPLVKSLLHSLIETIR